MADKLRTTYPLRIQFAEGEQPTALKLSAISSQAKSGLNIVEKAIGDLWGNGGDTNIKGLQIPTLGRVIGENKYLNPALYALHGDTPFYYIENLNTNHSGKTTGYLTFVPYDWAPGGGFDIQFGDNSGTDITGDYNLVNAEEYALNSSGDTKYWIDSVKGGTTGKFRFGSAISADLFIGYWVNPADWDLAQEDIVPGVIPDPRGIGTDGAGATLENYISAPLPDSGATYDYSIELPLRAPLDADAGSGYTLNLPFQLPVQTIYSSLDLNSNEGIGGHAAFASAKIPRLWAYGDPSNNEQFYRYRIPSIESLSSGTKIPDGTLYLCYLTSGDYEVIEGLEFHRGTNTYDISIKDTAGLLLSKITAVDTANHNPERWVLITCGPSVTKRLWALDHSFSHHTHDGTHGDNPFENLKVDGKIDGGLVIANTGDATTSGFSFDSINDPVQAGIQWHQGFPDTNPTNGLTINSENNVIINLDVGGNTGNNRKFAINDHANTERFKVEETGNTTIAGTLGVTGLSTLSTLDVTGHTDLNTLTTSGVIIGGTSLTTTGNIVSTTGNIVSTNGTVETDSATLANDGTITGTSLDAGSGLIQTTGEIDAGYFEADVGSAATKGYGFDLSEGSDKAGFQFHDGSVLTLNSTHNVDVNLDTDNNSQNSYFRVKNALNSEIFRVNIDGFTTIGDNLLVEGDAIHIGATSGANRIMLQHYGGNGYQDWETGNFYWRYNGDTKMEIQYSSSDLLIHDGNIRTITAGKYVDSSYFKAKEGVSATQGYGFSLAGDAYVLPMLGIQYSDGNTLPANTLQINAPGNIAINMDTNDDSGGNEIFTINSGNEYASPSSTREEVFRVDGDGKVTQFAGSTLSLPGSSTSSGSPGIIDFKGVLNTYHHPGIIKTVEKISFDCYNTFTSSHYDSPQQHGIQSSALDNTATYHLKMSSFGSLLFVIDSNDNDTNAKFTVYGGGDGTATGSGGYGTPDVLFDIDESGVVTINGHVKAESGTSYFHALSAESATSSFHALSLVKNGSIMPKIFIKYGTGEHEHWTIKTDDSGTASPDLYFWYDQESRGYIESYTTNNAIYRMNDFTGQHTSISENLDIRNNIEEYVGLIVSSLGSYRNIQKEENEINSIIEINEALPMIDLTSQRKDKKVFGVISDAEDSNTNRVYRAGAFCTPLTKLEGDNRITINALGEGAIWVCNINGNLFNGDYITSCEVPGLGMLQEDDLLHNYTVAKITCDCDFDLNSTVYRCEEFQFNGETYKKAFVGCTYHCG